MGTAPPVSDCTVSTNARISGTLVSSTKSLQDPI